MISLTPAFPGRNSDKAMFAAFTSTAGMDVIGNESLVAFCLPGPLKTLLQQTYADEAAFQAAWQAVSGQMKELSTGKMSVKRTSTPDMRWSLSAAGAPQITVQDTASGHVGLVLRIS